MQFNDADSAGGANEMSLSRARENFKRIGAISDKALRWVRKPTVGELPVRLRRNNE